MDDFDFDFDEFAGFGDVDVGNIDLSSFNWDDVDLGSVLDTVDLDSLSNFGFDLSNIGNFAEDVEEQAGGFYGNMPGRAVYDPKTNTTQLYNPTTDTFRTITHGDAGDIADQLASDFWRNQFGMGQDDYEDDLTSDFWRNILTGGGDDAEQGNVIVTGTKNTDTGDDEEDDGVGTVVITGTPDGEDDDEDPPVECPPGSERRVTQPDGAVWTYNCKGELIDKTEPPGDDTCPPGSETTQKFDDGSTITYDCKGNVISSTTSTDDECPPNSNTKETLSDGTVVVKDCKGNILSTTKPTTKPDTKTVTPPGSDWTKWLALLGGILGLLDRPKGGPVGYQGTIPKYTATRGPSRSPTEGGRRPGGAGIGSLTGGVTYTPVTPPVGAAGGGLMGLATGGKPRTARYLRGGTDGMADKIQTDIDGKQPARLSHGEFVIPADVVSHLGNGNSDAGAKVLYDMMAKVRKARTGTTKQGTQINPNKFMPGKGR